MHMANANEAVYQRVREAIIYGEYEPGTAIGEVELSRRFETSRTPVREALRRLTGEGLVATRGRGIAVKRYTKAEIRETYDLRALLEGYGATLLAGKATKSQIVELRKLNRDYDVCAQEAIRSLGTPEHPRHIRLLMDQNTLFHNAILGYGGNAQLHSLASRVMVIPLMFQSFSWCDAHELQTSYRAHDLLVTAIEEGDPERAKSAMTEHVYRGRDYVMQQLRNEELKAKNVGNPPP